MGQAAGWNSLRLQDSRVPIWGGAALMLLGLSLLAGWLTGASERIHESVYQERLRAAQGLEREGRFESAALEFRRALEIKALSFEARLGLAGALLQLGRWQEATQHLAQLRKSDPTSGPVQLLSARAALAAGTSERAAEFFQRAVYGYWPPEREAERMPARLEFARHLARIRDYPALLGELARLQSELPPEARARLEVARLFHEAGQPAEAAAAYRLYLAHDRRSFTGWLGLGDAEQDSGNLSEARRAYFTALSLHAASQEAREKLNVVTAAINLDPMARRLGRQERESRAARLVQLTAERLNACTATMPPSARAQVQPLLEVTMPATVDERIDLAETLWASCQKFCPPVSPQESPLPLVFRLLQRGQS